MRAVIQRATSGEVRVDGEVVGRLALPADSAGDEAGAGAAAQVSSRGVGTPGDVDATIGEPTSTWEGSIGARQGLVVLLVSSAATVPLRSRLLHVRSPSCESSTTNVPRSTPVLRSL